MDPPGSSVHEILQARILEWVVTSFFPSPGDIRDPGIESRSPALQADSLPSDPPGKPYSLWSWKELDMTEQLGTHTHGLDYFPKTQLL